MTDRFIKDIVKDISGDRGVFPELRGRRRLEYYLQRQRDLMAGGKLKEPSYPQVEQPPPEDYPSLMRGYDSPSSGRMTAPPPEPPPPPDERTMLEYKRSRGIPLSEGELQSLEDIRHWGEQPVPPKPIRRGFTEVSKGAKAVAETPLFDVFGVPVTATDLAAVALIGIGGYYGVKATFPAAKKTALNKLATTYDKTFGKSMDKMIAQRARGIPKEQFSVFQNQVWDKIAKDRIWLQDRATQNMLKRMGRTPNVERAIQEAVDDTIAELEARLLPAVTPGGSAVPGQTRPLAQIQGGLSMELKPEIPRPEPGMPEAGVQPSMIEEVAGKEVRPKGKGQIVQISMGDQLKLEQARNLAGKDIASIKNIEGLQSTKAEIETELGNRSIPYHGGEKAGAYTGWTTRQLDEMVKVYDEAITKTTGVTPVTEGVMPLVKPITVKPAIPKEVTPTVTPKVPIERRTEIKELLDSPAKQLPKGITKIALRQELKKIEQGLVPQEKKLRQQIMIAARDKALPQSQLREIFKSVSGTRYLSNARLPELEKILKSVKGARPRRIGSKEVITPQLERQIQDTKRQFIDIGKISEADYPAILRALGLKTDKYVDKASFISPKEGRSIIKAMKRKSQLGFATIEQVVNDLVIQIKPPVKPPGVITAQSFDVPWGKKAGEVANSFLNRTYRLERIFLKLDKFKENGLFYKTFYQPLDAATDKKITGYYGNMGKLHQLLNENKINIGRLLTDKQKVAPNVVITPSEKIGVYLHSLNPDNLRHLKEGNKFSGELIKSISSSLTNEEKVLADWLHNYFSSEYPAINEAKIYVTDEPLDQVENYFPIRLQWKANPTLDYWQQIAKSDSLSFMSDWATGGIPKGFTKARTHEAIQPVDLDALSIFLQHLEAVEHYKAFIPVVADLQMVMKNNLFREALISKAGNSVYQVMDKWLKQVAEVNPLRPTSHAEATLRTLRVNAVTSMLGVNITTAMKQLPSFVSGAAEIGIIPSMNGLFTFLNHPLETRKLIKMYSPQIYRRTFEREIAEAKQMKSPSKVIAGKVDTRQVFMILTSTMDKVAVSSLWRGGFEDYLSKHPEDMKGAAKYAEKAIRRTQPFFDVKDLPEYYRSGEFMKALTTFTNQLNQYWNYFTFDVAGKYMVKEIGTMEALRRIILAFVVPAVMIGAISRSRLPKDAKDFGLDVASMAISTLPIVGSWINSGLKGFSDSGVVTTEAFNQIQQAIQDITQDEWGKFGLDALVGAATMKGIPVGQPRRTIQAAIDLSTGKTDDWMELIWGSYTREKALEEERRKESIVNAIDKLNKLDLDAERRDIQAAETINDLKRIGKRDYTFTTADLGTVIGDETYKVRDNLEDLPPIVSYYWSFRDESANYYELMDDQRKEYADNNPDFVASMIFWGRWTTEPSGATKVMLERIAKLYGISLESIPAIRKLKEK